MTIHAGFSTKPRRAATNAARDVAQANAAASCSDIVGSVAVATPAPTAAMAAAATRIRRLVAI